MDTYAIVYSDSSTTTFTVANGKDGKDGHNPTISINENGYWCVDGVPTSIIAKGDKGDSISDVTYSYDESRNTIVKITLSSGEDRYFAVAKGDKGDDGVSVVSIELTSSEGSRDTYTIAYSDGTTSSFVVTNGADGPQGVQGVPGEDGHTPVISIGDNGNWHVDGVDTGVPARGPKGDKGDTGKDAVTYIPCIFNNYDGAKLYEFYYEKGSDIVYNGPIPTKQTIDQNGDTLDWTFVGWDKPLTKIEAPTIFTAQFEYLYTCTFVNYDGSVLSTQKVNRGNDASYIGDTPVRPSEVSGDQTIDWRFTGWDKSHKGILEDTVFTAQFDAPNAIKLTFKNYDGSVLFTQYCGMNANVKYLGPAPTKPEENQGDGEVLRYSFVEWDNSLRGITKDSIFTPTFSSTPYFRCRFFGGNGQLLCSTFVFKGGEAEYQGKTPAREQEASESDVTEFAFDKWDKPTGSITRPTDFKSKFGEPNCCHGLGLSFFDFVAFFQMESAKGKGAKLFFVRPTLKAT